MNKKAGKLLSYLLIVLCICTVVRSVRFINQQYKWSPIDEFAHFDYVEKICEGRLPKLSDPVSEELFQSIINDTIHSYQRNTHTRAELGMGNFSYEAIHPPLYYLVLSIPDLLMKKMDLNIIQRLKILRLCSYFIFVAGMLICIPVFNSLNKLGYKIPLAYALGCVLFGLLIITNQRYGLGNNMMSPLIINTCAYFLIQYYISPTLRNLYLFIAFCCLSIFTAIGNIFIMPVLFLFIFKKYKDHFSLKSFFTGSFIIAGSILLFYGWKKITAPDPFIDKYIHDGLSYMIPAGAYEYRIFWELLLGDMLKLSFMSSKLEITKLMLLLFVISNGICLLYIRSIFAKNKWLICCGILFMAFLAWTFLLNKYVAAVYWDAFRHYLGFIPVLYVSCTAFIPVLYTDYMITKEKQEEQLL